MSRPPLVIGRGTMGEVFLANYLGETVVVKRQVNVEKKNLIKIKNEKNILKKKKNDSVHFSRIIFTYRICQRCYT
jgi:hypothetical protein